MMKKRNKWLQEFRIGSGLMRRGRKKERKYKREASCQRSKSVISFCHVRGVGVGWGRVIGVGFRGEVL